MRIALIGYGKVGSAIARALLRAGHDVVLAARPDDTTRAEAARTADPALAGASVARAAEAVPAADAVVLAIPFGALADVLPPLREHLRPGTVVIDATNPVGPGLTHALGSTRSGASVVADLLPESRVVKAFNVYGYENLDMPPTGPDGLRAVMPYAGEDEDAKALVARLLDRLGWDALDMGGLDAAIDLEHLVLMWVRLVRLRGHSPRLVWAALGDR